MDTEPQQPQSLAEPGDQLSILWHLTHLCPTVLLEGLAPSCTLPTWSAFQAILIPRCLPPPNCDQLRPFLPTVSHKSRCGGEVGGILHGGRTEDGPRVYHHHLRPGDLRSRARPAEEEAPEVRQACPTDGRLPHRSELPGSDGTSDAGHRNRKHHGRSQHMPPMNSEQDHLGEGLLCDAAGTQHGTCSYVRLTLGSI